MLFINATAPPPLHSHSHSHSHSQFTSHFALRRSSLTGSLRTSPQLVAHTHTHSSLRSRTTTQLAIAIAIAIAIVVARRHKLDKGCCIVLEFLSVLLKSHYYAARYRHYVARASPSPSAHHHRRSPLSLHKLDKGCCIVLEFLSVLLKMAEASTASTTRAPSKKKATKSEVWEHFGKAIDEKTGNVENFDHRFQRTDQWMPVYSWLETLDTDEVVKSKEIIDWLTENPDGPEFTKNMSLSEVQESEAVKKSVPLRTAGEGSAGMGCFIMGWGMRTPDYRSNFVDYNLSTVPKDSEIYKAKQTEALHKYETLVELEKQLSMHLPKPENIVEEYNNEQQEDKVEDKDNASMQQKDDLHNKETAEVEVSNIKQWVEHAFGEHKDDASKEMVVSTSWADKSLEAPLVPTKVIAQVEGPNQQSKEVDKVVSVSTENQNVYEESVVREVDMAVGAQEKEKMVTDDIALTVVGIPDADSLESFSSNQGTESSGDSMEEHEVQVSDNNSAVNKNFPNKVLQDMVSNNVEKASSAKKNSPNKVLHDLVSHNVKVVATDAEKENLIRVEDKRVNVGQHIVKSHRQVLLLKAYPILRGRRRWSRMVI
ncbi:hypothetical protein RND71_017737 [Anisodus tanguticus]|uniref:Uncharacterized protein n=1 Tax=Anisodus tanguticus TaxID=243964 RepID=A0AAE1S4Q8_9SOLA|nr:hypothetical protein RND71_017737 [Anisodus tanguticus]